MLEDISTYSECVVFRGIKGKLKDRPQMLMAIFISFLWFMAFFIALRSLYFICDPIFNKKCKLFHCYFELNFTVGFPLSTSTNE